MWNGPAPARWCGVATWAFDTAAAAEAWPHRGFVGVVLCSPAAWDRFGTLVLASQPVALVRLAGFAEDPGWAGDGAYDAAAGTWAYAAWPGVRFAYPPARW